MTSHIENWLRGIRGHSWEADTLDYVIEFERRDPKVAPDERAMIRARRMEIEKEARRG